MASKIVESSSELIHLFTDISSKLSPAESENVVKSLKTIYGKPFDSVENEDLLSCLGLLHKLGYVSTKKLALIREFVAPKSNKQNDICEAVDNFRASLPPQVDPEEELVGRSDDFKKIMDQLETCQPSVVNVHGSAGVGKTTLGKAICSKWHGNSYIFDLREAKDMRTIYWNIMNNLGLTVPVGYLSFRYVVDRIFEHTVKDSDGQPVLFLLDNVEQFTLGQGKEGKNLRTAFMQFLGKLSECDDSGKMRPLRVLLTSRTQFNDAQKVIDHELQPLKDSDPETILYHEEMSGLNTELKQRLVSICKGKPLLLRGVRAIIQQGRKAPSDLIEEVERLIHMDNKEKADTPDKSQLEEDMNEKPFDLEQEGLDTSEQSVMKEIFNTLPSDRLKVSAVSLSLFRGPFTAATAGKVLGISEAETVAHLEGLDTNEIGFVSNREAKELMFDIHPLWRKYTDSMKNDPQFAESYSKARYRFYEHFMSVMKTELMTGFDEAFYEALNLLFNDQLDCEFVLEFLLLPEFFSMPSEFYDMASIASFVQFMLPIENQRELFHCWAEMCQDDGKSGSLFRAQLRCWEARHMLDAGGPRKAFEILQQAALSLEKVQDRTTERFQLTRGFYLYFEGEIYYQKKDYKKALECLHSSLELTEKVHEVHTSLAKCYNAMGNCYYGLNKREKALEFYTKAMEMRKELSKGSEYHYDMPVYKNQIGTVCEDQGEYEKAVEYYTDAIRLLEELKISGYEDEALFCRNLANALLRQNKIREAIIPADKAHSIRSKLLGKHPDTVRSIFQLGVIQAILGDYQKALDRFLEAWEMEKSLEPGNHSAAWKLIMKSVNDMSNFLLDESDGKEIEETIRKKKEEFEADALRFCKRFWKEERELSQFGFTEYNKDIIDTIMELLGDDEEGRDEYEKETLWFYDGYQSATEADFYKVFEEKKDIEELNEMLDGRLKFLQTMVELCVRLDQRERRVEVEEKKLALYRKALLREETKWIMVARRRTINGVLLLCEELKKEKLGRRYGKEALIFFDGLLTAWYDEMNVPLVKDFLLKVKDVASSCEDHHRVKQYQDTLQGLSHSSIRYWTQGDLPLREETMDHPEVCGATIQQTETLKVTLLGSEWASSAGGLSTFNRELAIHLSGSRHPKVEVTFFVPEGACTDKDKEDAQRYDVKILEAKERLGYDRLEWLISPPKKHTIEVVVGNSVKLGRQVPFIKEFRDCKWVQVVHTAPEDLSKYKAYTDSISEGEKKHQIEVDLCRGADLVVSVGPRLKESYSSYLRRSKKDEDIFSLTPGLFERELGELTGEQLPNRNSDFKVLLCGRGDDEDFELKGYDIAAKAFATHRLKGKRFQLLFVGAAQGKHEEMMERLCGCGIAKEQLTVRKFIQSRERMKDLFCEVDLSIMPSRSEGFGLVSLEALSAGLPILVSSKSGFARAIENMPFSDTCTVTSNEPEKWAEAIEAARNKHGERLEEVKKLRDCYKKKYNWDGQCKALVEKMWRMVHGEASHISP